MNYFTTTSSGQDWLGRQWQEGSQYQEENPNHLFLTYSHPLLAKFFNPLYEQYSEIKIWQCVGVNGQVHGLQTSWTELALLKAVEVSTPTLEQYITFGIICSLNSITNQVFTTWALNWLKNIDRSPATAKQVAEQLLELVLVEDVSCGHAAAHAAFEQPEYYAACAAHRAYFMEPLPLEKLAHVAMSMTPEDIGHMLG
jgi:hypothetical protein